MKPARIDHASPVPTERVTFEERARRNARHSRRVRKPHRPRRRGWILGFAIVALLLIALRAALPTILKHYVNDTLDELDGYSGSVADIDVRLWRGAYQIRGLNVVKTGGKVPVPFVEVSTVDLSVQWKALLQGSIVAEIELFEPKLNFVAAEKPEQRQTEPASNWTDSVRELSPFEINRVAIHDGQIHYRDFETRPRVDIFVQKLDATIHNITNTEKVGKNLYASFEGSALAMGSGQIRFQGRVNPYADQPTFSLGFSLSRLELKQLNNFLQAYANVDAEAGTFSLDAEFSASHGKFSGYAKPFIKDMQVLKWSDEQEGFFGKLWEGVVEVAGELFENQDRDEIATRVPLRGSVESPDADVLSTIFGVLRNAFLQAMRRGIEGSLGSRAASGLEKHND